MKTWYAIGLVACAIGAGFIQPARPARAVASEWPATWDGRALRPLAASDVELRFAARFPGAMARLTDGERQFVWREVREPTRMLHPAADCYRAAGFNIAAERLEVDAKQRRWRCFDATGSDGRRLRVCERIVDANGAAFTDASSWFWAALLGRSTGPWQAMTVVQSS